MTASSPTSAIGLKPDDLASGVPWWRSAVVYQIYIRSFADSNGDGIGDLPGITSHLPHIAALGADAIWITPFYPSPMHDTGYDCEEFCDVDARFGTLADFDELIREAHALGLRVLIDIVPTYTAITHPWFVSALADPASPHRAKYHFRDPRPDGGPPNNWPAMFGGGPAWTRDEHGQYYLHIFTPQQPDLDWNCPDVHEEFRRILRFWLDRGTDGFRVDVADHLYKRRGLPDRPPEAVNDPDRLYPTFGYGDQEEMHEVYREWRSIVEEYGDDRYLIGEIALPADRLARYLRPGELHGAFNLGAMRQGWGVDALREMVDAAIEPLRGTDAVPTWVLSNHDIVRHVTRYGGGESGRARGRAAMLFLLALPGCVYVYQGDELGLEEVVDLPAEVRQDPIYIRSGGAEPGRDGCRVPIPWSASGSGLGFSQGTPWLPMPQAWASVSVAAQDTDPESMLNFYREAIATRREQIVKLPAETAWLPAPAGCLVIRRGTVGASVIAALNGGAAAATVAAEGELIAASSDDVTLADGVLALPADSAAWVLEADHRGGEGSAPD